MNTYACIDLKSFYASVECVDRGLNPLDTFLVVADPTRTPKTICLAATPPLKSYGLSGRSRLFEVIRAVREINRARSRIAAPTGETYIAHELEKNPALALQYIVAPPQMAHYMEVSRKIYGIYMRFISPEDMVVYSIDEVFFDLTSYLALYSCSAYELTRRMIQAVLDETGITATAGIGTNLYLAKIAMDITAKHMSPDKDGVRVAFLDERTYRETLWDHAELSDFWRVGKGTVKRLAKLGLYTMGDIARFSLDPHGEDLLFDVFGVHAEFLIDHAWGIEPCTMAAIHAYRPEERSFSSGQVLKEPTKPETALLIVREMADEMALSLLRKGIATNQIILDIHYDSHGVPDDYTETRKMDRYGRIVPKPSHGSRNLSEYTMLSSEITAAATELFRQIDDERLLIKKLNLTAAHVLPLTQIPHKGETVQYTLWGDAESEKEEAEKKKSRREKETRLEIAMLTVKERYGKNAVLRGMNYLPQATARERNGQIGGHRA